MNQIGIIPARYSSSRLPGKVILDIGGKSMIQRVYEQASKAIDTVVVATDDSRVEHVVKKFGGLVVKTSSSHKNGTDRCREAVNKITADSNKKYDIIVNIQGDEPFIHPDQIKYVLSGFNDKTNQIVSLGKKIINKQELFDPNTTKLVINSDYQAIYFSRNPIPYMAGVDKNQWIKKHNYYKHIGIYGFRNDILDFISRLKPSALELAESLEQNRWLENGIKIGIKITKHDSLSVDTAEDLEEAKKYIAKNNFSE